MQNKKAYMPTYSIQFVQQGKDSQIELQKYEVPKYADGRTQVR